MSWLDDAPLAEHTTCRTAETRGLELAGHLNAVNAQLTAYTADLIATGAWVQGAATTPSMFLQWKLGLSPARADDIVTIASQRSQFPVLVAGFDRGELSLEQVAAAMKAPAHADADMYEFARIATVTKIRRFVRANTVIDDTDTPPVGRVSFGARHGRWHLHAELGVDDGRRVQAALEESRDRQFSEGNESVGWADALVDVAERSVDTIDSPSRRDSYRTWLHLDVTTGNTTTTDGWRVPMAVRDRILCDSIVQPVWERDGVAFSVGRTQRIVPDRTRRIIERRDRGCRAPGCNAERHVEIHHIIHWLHGGTTDTWNLVSLCPHHHRLHHHGRLGITGNADHPNGIVFTDARGSPIPPVGTPIVPTGPPPTTPLPYDPPLAERFDWSWINGWARPDQHRTPVDELAAGTT